MRAAWLLVLAACGGGDSTPAPKSSPKSSRSTASEPAPPDAQPEVRAPAVDAPDPKAALEEERRAKLKSNPLYIDLDEDPKPTRDLEKKIEAIEAKLDKLGGLGGATGLGGGTSAAGRSAGHISVTSKSGGSGSTLTPDVVLARILSAYAPRILGCYRAYLAKDASARGAVILTFDVDETGRAVRAVAGAFPANDVNDCVTGDMASWRFPAPKDADGEKQVASYTVNLALVPD